MIILLGDIFFFFVGYLLGGCVVLDYIFYVKNLYLFGMILEGINIGLKIEVECKVCW